MADLTPPEGIVERLAELAVTFGANVQPGQIVGITGELGGHEPLVRAVAEAAYRRGARFVDVNWFDPRVKRARIEHAADDTLDFVPPWYGNRVLGLGAEKAALVAITGPTEPGLFDDLDPARAGKDRLPAVKESLTIVNERSVNWTIVPFVTEAWARLVRPDVPVEEAYATLWDEIIHVCRLDEDDPAAVWSKRMDAIPFAFVAESSWNSVAPIAVVSSVSMARSLTTRGGAAGGARECVRDVAIGLPELDQEIAPARTMGARRSR